MKNNMNRDVKKILFLLPIVFILILTVYLTLNRDTYRTFFNRASEIAVQPVGQPSGWQLIFSDEFDGTSVDLSKWEPSWFGGNGFSRPINDREDNCYSPSQLSVSGGLLKLTTAATNDSRCIRKNGSKATIVSGLVNTREKFSFKYGYAEARIFLPGSGGKLYNWPAWWTNGYDKDAPWPAHGEIDIMEGLRSRHAEWTYHFKNSSGQDDSRNREVNMDATGWHVYATKWEPGKISFYYDGNYVGETTEGVIDLNHYLILNHGTFSDYTNGALTGQTMQVDYVRVWQLNPTQPTVAPPQTTNAPTASQPTLTPTPIAEATAIPNPTSVTEPSTGENLIVRGDMWKYLDDGSNQGTAWKGVNYDDSAWKYGRAQLGYGDRDEQTTISYGGDSQRKYITTYFRRELLINDPSTISALNLELLRDDGAVVYLNGREVYRSNMPNGTIGYLTGSARSIEDTRYYSASIDPSLLQAGKNVLAVEVHQSDPDSSDVSFDASLTATVSSGAQPTATPTRTPTPTPLPPEAYDTESPQVTILSPTRRDTLLAGDSNTIRVQATDNLEVASVEVYIDNTLIKTLTSSPYTISWIAPTAPAQYTIKVVATDTAGNTATSQVKVKAL